MGLYPFIPPPFTPPFCPNPKCKHHRDLHPAWRFKRAGFFRTCSTRYPIQRFTCTVCRRCFSTQTFSTSYWLKQPGLPRLAFMKIVGGMAARQIARDLQCAPSTIDRLIGRLGRHCYLLHTLLTEGAKPEGPQVLDSFESFEFSQYFPFLHHLLVEANTSFLWHFTESPLRRKGRMTEAQKRRRRGLEGALGRPDPRAPEKDVGELLKAVLERVPEVTLRSDDHRSYPKAIRALACLCTHEVTSSKERRTAQNPLFEVNWVDGLIRHSQANHRRETWAFSKRRQGSSDRLAIFGVWRNYVKLRFEKRCQKTPAMLKGLLDSRWKVEDVLKERLFRTRIELSKRWSLYYDRMITTPALERNCRHELKYAY